MCAGHIAGIEAAIHAVRSAFGRDSTAGVLLVDASNAFNSLNSSVAVQNIKHLCPILATFSINCYQDPCDLFVGGTSIKFQEGTTQGDPLAMPLYSMATIPLIKELSSRSDTTQAWYADDSAAMGTIANIHTWWETVVSH